MTDTLHENKNYYVCIDSVRQGYNVVNFVTGVVEDNISVLPEAIHMAEQCNHALINKPWEWLTKKENNPSMH